MVPKTVLTRIISIVCVPSLYPNKDNTINRDDDAKHSPLSVKHVADFVFFGRPGASGLGSSPGHCVVFLGKTLYSHSASLHPGV